MTAKELDEIRRSERINGANDYRRSLVKLLGDRYATLNALKLGTDDTGLFNKKGRRKVLKLYGAELECWHILNYVQKFTKDLTRIL